jgi:hypothetical protein
MVGSFNSDWVVCAYSVNNILPKYPHYCLTTEKGETYEKIYKLFNGFFAWMGGGCMELFRFNLSKG